MSRRVSKTIPGWILVLALALVVTSLQAKLGLYRPEHSEAQLISKAFKPSECRLDRAILTPPVVTVPVAISFEASEQRRPLLECPEYAPPQPSSPLPSRSHWFRPPPFRS